MKCSRNLNDVCLMELQWDVSVLGTQMKNTLLTLYVLIFSEET